VYIDRGEPLPQSYAENRIVAMVRSPEQIYVYWDVETEVRVAGSRCVVRVHCRSEGRRNDHEPGPEACNWYFRVTPNRAYRFELLESRGGQLRSLASSEEVTTPVRWAGESGLRVPEEIVHAARRPISRENGAPDELTAANTGRRALKLAAAAAMTPWHVTLPDSDRGTAAQRATAPPDVPPTPIPTPREKLFAAAYARPRPDPQAGGR